MNSLTTKSVFELSNKIGSSVKNLSFEEVNLLKELIEERANKMKIAQRKNVLKYVDDYLAQDGTSDTDTVSHLINWLDPIRLSNLFKRGKILANGEIIYADLNEFFNNCNQNAKIKDLRKSVI
jgi:hypothetical protein